jgi:H+/Cl- antiporter ClcA
MSIPNGYTEEIYKESLPRMRRRTICNIVYDLSSMYWILIHFLLIAIVIYQLNHNLHGNSLTLFLMYIPVSIVFYAYSCWIFYNRKPRRVKYLFICSVFLIDITLYFLGPINRDDYNLNLTAWEFWSSSFIFLGIYTVICASKYFMYLIYAFMTEENPIDRQEPLEFIIYRI